MRQTRKQIRDSRTDIHTDNLIRKIERSELAYDASHRNYAKSTSAISSGKMGGLWSGRTDLGRIGKPTKDASRQQQVVVTDVESVTDAIRKEFRKFTI